MEDDDELYIQKRRLKKKNNNALDEGPELTFYILQQVDG